MRALAIALTLTIAARIAAAEEPRARLEVGGVCELGAVANRANEMLGRVAIQADERASFTVSSERTEAARRALESNAANAGFLRLLARPGVSYSVAFVTRAPGKLT
jgi:hypothetical protein